MGPPVVIEGQRLDPDVQWLLWLDRRLGAPPLTGNSAAEARRNFSRTAPLFAPEAPGVEARELTLAGAAGPLGARRYRPAGLGEAAPALIYFHGGGWVVGDLESHDGVCRALAAQADCVVIAVDYRRAPEAPYPAAADDALAALRDVLGRARELGLDPARVAVGGDSAGGNLSAVTALRARDEGLAGPAFQLLIYPGLDMSRDAPSYRTFARGFLLSYEDIAWFRDHYCPDHARRSEPFVSPLLAADLRGVAPACVLTAGFDPLRDEGRAYAARLAEAGVPVEDACFPDLVHGFMNLAGVIPAARRAFDHAARALRLGLARAPQAAS